ncbi:PDZ and LIM domain protein 2 isoform X2 [Chiroxiphia lanceolata]|uniref:PDZ and LIM domain protein 2 isoform X2 n=1 Tax=Chiroxiphia lanceolata TaxID=296741 RepID=UPI0013CEE024|nr:PDZ and LIM domain protein 2 isoform X2 [Chiroxiphia lanceolata]
MPVTVTLPGPAPWGFRISGGRDFGKPITVSKVTEHGKAATGDLRAGDVIVTINGESTAEMLHVEAQNKIKQSPGQLRLEVERSPMPPPSHTNGDASLERLATRVQDTPRTRDESQGALRAPDPSLASPIRLPHSASSQPLEEEFACPGLCQERGILTRQNSCQGSILPPPPCPPSPGFEAPQNPWETPRERRPSLSPNTCNRHLPPRGAVPQPGLGAGHEALGGGLGGLQDAAGEPGAAGGPAAIQHLPPAPGGAGGRGRRWSHSPLPQPALVQRPQTRGRGPEAARLREVREQHRHAGGADPGRAVPAPVLLQLRRLRPQPQDEGPLLGGRRAVLRETRPPALPGPPGGARVPPARVPPLLSHRIPPPPRVPGSAPRPHSPTGVGGVVGGLRAPPGSGWPGFLGRDALQPPTFTHMRVCVMSWVSSQLGLQQWGTRG